MNLELVDKTALISGSTKGIGFAVASQLAAEGARVIVNGRSDSAVNSALKQIRKTVPEAKIEGFAGDLASDTATEDLLKHFPAVDILVNNLGIYEPKSFDTISDEDWLQVFKVNVLSGVRLSRAYVSGMKQRNWGRIIFISSESGISTPKEADKKWRELSASTDFKASGTRKKKVVLRFRVHEGNAVLLE